MMRSLYSGVSGLRNHQTRMDVIGNNIANVNTVGYKAGRVIFQDMYSQNMKAASSPGETTGGTNPQQIGLGMTLSTIDTLFTRSAAQVTGSTYDLMIENDGFFVVRNGYGASYEEYYTRAGNFYEDKEHYLVTAGGFYLQGYKASLFQGDDPVVGQGTEVTDTWKTKTDVPARVATVTSSEKKAFEKCESSLLNDSINGKKYTITAVKDPVDDKYTVTITETSSTVVPQPSAVIGIIDFDDPTGARSLTSNFQGLDLETATFTSGADLLAKLNNTTLSVGNNGRGPLAIGDSVGSVTSLDLGAKNNNCSYEILVTDAAKREIQIIKYDANKNPIGRSTATLPAPSKTETVTRTIGDLVIELKANYNIEALDGMVIETSDQGVDTTNLGAPYYSISNSLDRIYVDENLYNISVDKNGNITGVVKADGIIKDPLTGESIRVLADQKVVIGRVAVATFDNQQGLEKVGSNLYRSTSNTGEAQYKSPGSDGAGQINPGALEMSNVDLAQEFTDMIVTQRGFQANSRIITVSDTLLEELVNLKR